ncbi:MAG: GNAT family N-acetyltransferase [Ferruginibacter sp.]
MIVIEKVGTDGIDTIHSLAHLIWQAAYKDILSPEQMAYMLELIYSKTSLHQQITEKHHQFIIAFENERPVGFASYSIKSSEEPLTYRLHKIYIDPAIQGKGLGKKLLQYILDDIQVHHPISLELNVNRHNKAIEFYKSMGFTIIKEEDIDIGNSYFMNDYIMNLQL